MFQRDTLTMKDMRKTFHDSYYHGRYISNDLKSFSYIDHTLIERELHRTG